MKTEEFDSKAAWRRFQLYIRPRRRPRMITVALYAAASLVLFVSVGVASFLAGERKITGALADVVVEAPAGATSTVFLPDGSKVTVNAGSTLTYSQDYGISKRSIRLDGQAFFDVVHNPDCPFEIVSPHLYAYDIGTSFDFCDYSAESCAVVTITEGNLSVSALGYEGKFNIGEGQKAEFDAVSKVMRKASADLRAANSWKNGELSFNDISLNDAARLLARTYGVSVRVSDASKGAMRVYGSFHIREHTATGIMDILCQTGEISYRYDGETIVIS
ncbi:MAG: DUF4974 domain-containing protein [Bacteroidales bacterium]|nr:DUF4974 domain-containing protein [Bacteroidales bacterium]